MLDVVEEKDNKENNIAAEEAQQEEEEQLETLNDTRELDSQWFDETSVAPSMRRRFAVVRKSISVRDRAKLIMDSNRYHFAVIFFILLDIGLVAAELIIEHDKKKFMKLDKFIKYFGLSILSLFMIELIFKIALFRDKFFRSKFEIFDAIAIVVSFFVDLAFILHRANPAFGFITALRLWRLARIANSILVTVQIRARKRIDKYKIRLHELNEERDMLKEQLERQNLLLNEIKIIYSI